MVHSHDSCTPDLDRDLVVTGMREPEEPDVPVDAGDRGAQAAAEATTVTPVVTVTPLNLRSEVIDRSQQVPVAVLIGSPVHPGMSALTRELTGRATAANLRWILAIADADRFPQLVDTFRPGSLPTLAVVAGGTGVASWTPADGQGADGVDAGEFVEKVAATVQGRLDGLPAESTAAQETPGTAGAPVADPRLEEAAVHVSEGNPAAALRLYDAMLADTTDTADPQTTATLRRARAAVAVLERTGGIDRSMVLATVADLRGERPTEPDRLLRAADVLVLLDRPAEAVDLLSGALEQFEAADRDQLRRRVLELIDLLEPHSPAATRARRRIAAVVF